jgi:NADH-quinone oxidoreductase subunit C
MQQVFRDNSSAIFVLMTFEAILERIVAQFPGTVLVSDSQALQPWVQLAPEQLVAVCAWLRDEPGLYFDHLACLSGVDLGPATNRMEVVYHLASLTQGHSLVLRVQVPRTMADGTLPSVPTLSGVWRAADWHEREAFDLLGIAFEGHPDLRRMLLPADWQGHPLRKDYQAPDSYHGIDVAY